MKDRVKAREDIRMQIRITNLLLTTFVSFSSLMFLRILEKGELDRIPSLLALSEKNFSRDFRRPRAIAISAYLKTQRILHFIVDNNLSRFNHTSPLPSPPETSHIRGRSE